MNEWPEPSGGDTGVWLSIGDLMSVLFLFFALLFMTVLLQLSKTAEEAEDSRRVIIGTLVEQLNGNNIKVDVNEETGDLSIREKIEFEQNACGLTKDAKVWLKAFVPIYAEVLLSSPEHREQISAIVIEGHASSDGDAEENLTLAACRAASVASFMLYDELDLPERDHLEERLIVASRGEIEASDAVRSEDRRVVFRLQFKDPEFLAWLDDTKQVEVQEGP